MNDSPWDTSTPVGASLEGTLSQPPPQADPMAGLANLQSQLFQQQQPQMPPIGSVERKSDGTFNLKGVSGDFLADVMGQLNDLKTMQGAAMARVAQLRQQESSGSPLLDALSQFAGGMAANDPTMPGWVRALGATSLQMGPQGIKRERMMEEQRALAYGKEAADLSMQAVRFGSTMNQQAAMIGERQQNNWEQLRAGVNATAQKGILPDKNYFFREGLALGKDLPALESEWKNAETLAKNYETQKAEADKRATDKAVAIEKGKAPVRVEVGKELIEARTDAAKELIDKRAGVANELVDKRYRMFQDRILTRMDAKRVDQLATIPPKTRENLIATSEMDQFINRMEEFIGPNGKLRGRVGPIQGLITAKLPSSLSDSDRQVAQHLFGVEKKRVIDFARAGVRGWAPGEDAIRKVGLIETLTPDAAARVIDEIRQQININRRAAVQASRYAPWDQMPELLGGAGSPIYKEAAKNSGEFFSALEGVHQRSLTREAGGATSAATGAPAAPANPADPHGILDFLPKKR